jgi:hypothetical protein
MGTVEERIEGMLLTLLDCLLALACTVLGLMSVYRPPKTIKGKRWLIVGLGILLFAGATVFWFDCPDPHFWWGTWKGRIIPLGIAIGFGGLLKAEDRLKKQINLLSSSLFLGLLERSH